MYIMWIVNVNFFFFALCCCCCCCCDSIGNNDVEVKKEHKITRNFVVKLKTCPFTVTTWRRMEQKNWEFSAAKKKIVPFNSVLYCYMFFMLCICISSFIFCFVIIWFTAVYRLLFCFLLRQNGFQFFLHERSRVF